MAILDMSVRSSGSYNEYRGNIWIVLLRFHQSSLIK